MDYRVIKRAKDVRVMALGEQSCVSARMARAILDEFGRTRCMLPQLGDSPILLLEDREGDIWMSYSRRVEGKPFLLEVLEQTQVELPLRSTEP